MTDTPKMSRLARQLVEADAQRPQPEPETNGKCEGCGATESKEPRYEFHRSWFIHLFGTGCLACGSAGWFQRQIMTPRRIARFSAWFVTLAPRGWSMLRTILSRNVDEAVYAERMEVCYNHNRGSQACAVRYLRQTSQGIVERLHCGKCNCPKTEAASLERKNRKAGWRCPAGLHAGSDRDAAFKEYVQVHLELAGASGTISDGNDHGD